jgi:hypothetical protein
MRKLTWRLLLLEIQVALNSVRPSFSVSGETMPVIHTSRNTDVSAPVSDSISHRCNANVSLSDKIFL